MNEPLSRTDPLPIAPVMRRRVSWGAIWVGMFVTIVLQIMFTFLGIACGIATLNPFYNPPSEPPGFSLGADIWLMVSWLLSVGVGAYAGGWMSGGPRRADGAVHGLAVWSFSAAIILLFLTGVLGRAGGLTGGLAGHQRRMGMLGQQSATVLNPTGHAQGEPGNPAGNENTGADRFFGDALWLFIALVLGLAVAVGCGASGSASSNRSLTASAVV